MDVYDYGARGHQPKKKKIDTLEKSDRSILIGYLLLQSTHAHLFLQGDDKLYINQGESLRKIYHNGKSIPLNPNVMDSNVYSSSSKQGNLFSQSYNISMESYMCGEFISVPNEGKTQLNMLTY